MPFWEKEPFPGFVSSEYFKFSDPGQLHEPILSHKLYRTDKLALALETLCGAEAITNGLLKRDQDVLNEANQRAELKHIASDTRIRLSGVIPYRLQTHEGYRRDKVDLQEQAQVFSIEYDARGETAPLYTIDWLENAGTGFFLFPDQLITESKTDYKRAYGRAADALVMKDDNEGFSSGRAALKLHLAGIDLYLTANKSKDGAGQIKPGYILYCGLLDEDTRRKIRTIISFALGLYLVHLGHSTYTAEWELKAFRAITSYSMDMRAFDLHTLPPTLLGERSHNELVTAKVARLVEGLYANYETLDFGNLSWGYWHAMCAPLHIKAVHYGAIIEALQSNCMKAHAADFSEKIIPDDEKWGALSRGVGALIDGLAITDEQKAQALRNIGRLNQMPRAAVTDELLKRLGIELGEDEKLAWRRRHDAAHGNPMDPAEVQKLSGTRIFCA